jgi:hypothetical protein
MPFEILELDRRKLSHSPAGKTAAIADGQDFSKFIESEPDRKPGSNQADSVNRLRWVATVSGGGTRRTVDQTLALVQPEGIRTDSHQPESSSFFSEYDLKKVK